MSQSLRASARLADWERKSGAPANCGSHISATFAESCCRGWQRGFFRTLPQDSLPLRS